MGGAGPDTPWGTRVAEREQPHRWEAKQNFPLVRVASGPDAAAAWLRSYDLGTSGGQRQMVQEGRPRFFIVTLRDLLLQKALPSPGGGLRHRLSVPSLPSTPLSAWRSGWACAGRLARCQQLFLPPRRRGNWP